MKSPITSEKGQVRKTSILSSTQIKKLWRGELTRTAIYQHSPDHCNTVEAFKLIGEHIYSHDWSGKEMILLSYNLPPPPDRSKLYNDNGFCPDLAEKQKPYFDLFRVVAELCGREILRYNSHVSAGAWGAVDQDYEQISNLLNEHQEKALKICDNLADWLKVGEVRSFYRTSGTAGDTPINREEWKIDSPQDVFRSLAFNRLYGPSSTVGADSYLFFLTKDIRVRLQGFTQGIPTSGFTGSYQSEYMKAMDILIAKAKITTTNQPTIKDLQKHAEEALIECGLKPSKISVHRLSSFVRMKKGQIGGRRPKQWGDLNKL